MEKTMKAKISSYLSVVATFGSLAAIVLPVAAQEAAADKVSLEEVVVTARRRAESLQTVPISVSAFAHDEIEDRQIDSTLDVIRNVPNLVGSNNVGLSSATSLFIRGVGQDESLSTTDPAVGTYVDGVYIARQISNNAHLYDIERIEVLRGPQGTLFGRNTSGGAIQIITRKPDDEFKAEFEGSIGDYDSYMLKGRINVPLSDTVALNVAAFTAQREEGFQKNVTLGSETYDADSTGGRAALRITPSDNLDIVLTAEIGNQKDAGITGSNALGPNPDDLYVVQSGLLGSFNEIDQTALSANIVWVTGNVTWTSITGWRDLDHDFRLDFSDDPVPQYVIDQDGSHKQFSQEIQASGSVGDFDWMVGAFYMDEENDNVRRDELFLFGGAVDANLVATFTNDTETIGIFGQSSWNVTDKMSLTLGGRWTEEEKTLDWVQSIDIGGGILIPLQDNSDLEALGTDTRPTFDQFTPHVGIDYQISDGHMIYATYTEGFKSGGWNTRATDAADVNLIDSETAKAYEIGFKSEFMNSRLRLNGAFFINTYEDFIITAINPDTGGFVTPNAGEVEISGAEFELSVRATEHLSIYANIGTMSNEYKELGPEITFDINNEVKRTPEFSGQIGFNYRVPVGSSSAFILAADYSHQDEYFAGADNHPLELAPETDLVFAAASYEGGDGRWKLTAACSNCTDEEYYTSTLNFGSLGFATQFPGERRVYSLTLKVSTN
jgi:iron complex outermembrane receptor protein